MGRFRGTLFLAAACLALAALLPFAVSAADRVVELDPNRVPQRLLEGGVAWVDESGTATIEEIARDGGRDWRPMVDHAIYPLRHGNALWVRFTLRTEANPVGERWYIEVP